MRLAITVALLAASTLSCFAQSQSQPASAAPHASLQAAAPQAVLPNTGINLSKAAIEAGRLVVEGTTAAASTVVTVDGKFNKTSAATKAFNFSLVYLPLDCIIELKVGTKTDQAVVGSCGPKGANFIGPWLSTRAYQIDDLATLDGSTWRAKRVNTNKRPGSSAADWQMFAAKGAEGPMGNQGLKGDQGNTGPMGPPGAKGDAGAPGATGPQGSAGASGGTGPQGPKGDPGLQGNPGPAGPTGAPGATGQTGPQGPTGIVTTASIAGWAGSIPANSTWMFVAGADSYSFGQMTTVVTIESGQRITGSASASLGSFSDAADFKVALCSQQETNPVTPLGDHFFGAPMDSLSFHQPAGIYRLSYAANVSRAGLSPGTYRIGVCVMNDGPGSLDANGGVLGWVMVTK
jgi:hypothetical protein